MKILYISEVQWRAQISRKHQLVCRFPRDWHVTFASPMNLTPGENSLRLRADPDRPNVQYVSLPLPKPDSLVAPLRALTGLLSAVGKRRIRKLVAATRPDVVVTSFIWAAPAVPFVKELGIPVVYDCNDLHPDFYPSRSDEAWKAFRSLVEAADEVVASSSQLLRTCGRGVLVGNGVDLDTFAGRSPGPLPAPIAESRLSDCDDLVAYVGSLDARIDFDIIEGVLEAFEQKGRRRGLVCVGWVLETLARRKAELEKRFPTTVLFTGRKPYEELPGYLSAASVGIAPFLVNERTEAVNPNKLYMYAAMDMNVVSTPFSDEIRALSDSIFIANGPDEFAGAVMEALGDDERRRAMRDSIALPNSWDHKAREFVRILSDLAGKH